MPKKNSVQPPAIIAYNTGRADALAGRLSNPTSMAYAKGYAAGQRAKQQKERAEFSLGYNDAVAGKPIRPSSDTYMEGYTHGRTLSALVR